MIIDDLVDEIMDVVEKGFNLRLFHKNIVDGGKIIELSEEIKDRFPKDFEKAQQITKDRNMILDSAKSRAAEMVSKAENEANRMIENAKAEAENMVLKAQSQAKAMIEDARLDAAQLVSESNITKEANMFSEQMRIETKKDCDVMMNTTQAECADMISKAKAWRDAIESGAYNYAMDIMKRADDCLSGSSDSIRNLQQKIDESRPIHDD